MDRKSIKERGKAAFKANYWPSVLGAIVLAIAAGGGSVATGNVSSEDLQQSFNGMTQEELAVLAAAMIGVVAVSTVISLVLSIFVFGPLKVGGYGFFKDNLTQPAPVGTLVDGFKNNYLKNCGTLFLTDLFIGLWTLLFIIPGIVKSFSYFAVPFIRREHPEMSATEVITASRQMMNGHKWELFVMYLSFIGWAILDILTLGILGLFYVNPYIYSSEAAFYEALK